MLQSKSIGAKINAARKKANLSQAELAQKVSISAQAVGKWERGESMPDIVTLNRLAEIFNVDLNYFSDNFQSEENEILPSKSTSSIAEEIIPFKQKKKFSWNWNMSSGNWEDADFSGLKNLQEKFSSSNIRNCKFMNSDLSGLILANNNIEKCDFSLSDIRNSKFQSSNLESSQFNNCSFIDAQFVKNNIGKCNFQDADFSGAEFIGVNFEQNTVANAVWNFTSFKNSALSEIVFEGKIEDCHFENCSFHSVSFQNATLTNCFFKYNRKLNRVKFINCTVDSLTYAFLKNGKADLNGISVLA